MFQWLVTPLGLVGVPMLQTLLNGGHHNLLPKELTTESVRPRDRHKHCHLEAVLRIANMAEDHRKRFSELGVVCTRHPAPYPVQRDDINNLQNCRDLAISPSATSVCLCAEADGSQYLCIINKTNNKAAISLVLPANEVSRICFTSGKRLLLLHTDNTLSIASVKAGDWASPKALQTNAVVVTCGVKALRFVTALAALGSRVALAVQQRTVYVGTLEDKSLELRTSSGSAVRLQANILDLAVAAQHIYALLHGGRVVQLDTSAQHQHHEFYCHANARRIAITADYQLLVARQHHIDAVQLAAAPGMAAVQWLRPASQGDKLTDDIVSKATSGSVITIATSGNCIEFLDGAASALRFICRGSAMLAYIR